MRPHDKFHFVCAPGSRCYYVPLPAVCFLASRCFPMLPHCLPCRVSRGAATLPHRLPLRSIPPQRFACGSSHSRGHGRPRSVRKSSRLRWKCLSMDCRCSDIANLSAHLPRLPTPPPYLRQMRLLPGRGRRCCVQDEAVASQGRSVGWQMMLLIVRDAVPANHRAHESLF